MTEDGVELDVLRDAEAMASRAAEAVAMAEMSPLSSSFSSPDERHSSFVSISVASRADGNTADLRITIERAAAFVARNGEAGERVFMDNQRNNPKFEFLFGGEFHPYYR